MSGIQCQVYASRRREQMYLYVAVEHGLEVVPETLLKQFGAPREVMSLELNPGRPLARADVELVMRSLQEQGYYLQMPPSPADYAARRTSS